MTKKYPWVFCEIPGNKGDSIVMREVQVDCKLWFSEGKNIPLPSGWIEYFHQIIGVLLIIIKSML